MHKAKPISRPDREQQTYQKIAEGLPKDEPLVTFILLFIVPLGEHAEKGDSMFLQFGEVAGESSKQKEVVFMIIGKGH